jgi:hypothetical protein
VHQIGDVGCVLAYTSRDKLFECCGEFQPWAAVNFTALVADVRAKELAGPVLDLPLAGTARWTADGPPDGADLTLRG